MSETFERRVDFIPAFDLRNPDRNKDYGIGSMRIRFILKGELGAVQWMIGTPWDVASARRPNAWRSETQKPTGWDLGYHSPRPLYDEQSPMDTCDILSGLCYYDGSGVNADLLVENFISQGDEYAWAALEAYYRFTFEDADWPFDKDGNLIASCDTHPKDGDVQQAPLVSGAVPKADAQGPSK